MVTLIDQSGNGNHFSAGANAPALVNAPGNPDYVLQFTGLETLTSPETVSGASFWSEYQPSSHGSLTITAFGNTERDVSPRFYAGNAANFASSSALDLINGVPLSDICVNGYNGTVPTTILGSWTELAASIPTGVNSIGSGTCFSCGFNTRNFIGYISAVVIFSAPIDQADVNSIQGSSPMLDASPPSPPGPALHSWGFGTACNFAPWAHEQPVDPIVDPDSACVESPGLRSLGMAKELLMVGQKDPCEELALHMPLYV